MQQTPSSSKKSQLRQKGKVLERAEMSLSCLKTQDGEVEIVMEPQGTFPIATVVETSKFEPKERPQAQPSILESQATPTKNRTRAQTLKSSKSSTTVAEAGVGRKKQKFKVGHPVSSIEQGSTPKSSIPSPALSSPVLASHRPTTFPFGEPVVPKISVVLEVTSSRASRAASPDVVVTPEVSGDGSGSVPSSLSKKDSSQQPKERTPPLPSKTSSSTQVEAAAASIPASIPEILPILPTKAASSN
ncbi:flocculation protein FLO11-like [Malus sylvestris]|uniref:flocculation protein FLO11-like n=1 Tax=Malus sylvestris TaxID=3752 RepID=UPI0021AC61DE|nr:flocculation protein FLO11-like [Malus sylvestris]